MYQARQARPHRHTTIMLSSSLAPQTNSKPPSLNSPASSRNTLPTVSAPWTRDASSFKNVIAFCKQRGHQRMVRGPTQKNAKKKKKKSKKKKYQELVKAPRQHLFLSLVLFQLGRERYNVGRDNVDAFTHLQNTVTNTQQTKGDILQGCPGTAACLDVSAFCSAAAHSWPGAVCPACCRCRQTQTRTRRSCPPGEGL